MVIDGVCRAHTAEQCRPQPLRQKGITEGGGIAHHHGGAVVQRVVPIPDPQGRLPPLASCGIQPQAGQQLPQHRVGVGHVAADEGAHADAVAPQPGEGPAEAMADQAKFKSGSFWVLHGSLHLHGGGGGEAGPGRTQPQFGGKGRAGAIRQHQRLAAEAAARPVHTPAVTIALDRLHSGGVLQLGAGGHGLLHQELIELGAPHDPERRVARQHSGDRVLEAPAEAHLADHLIHGGAEIEGKPALHGGGHAAAAGLGPRQRLTLEDQHPPAPGRQMKRGGTTGSSGPHHDHIEIAHTLRMSASLSARSLSMLVMN